jgi:hypothetical protein
METVTAARVNAWAASTIKAGMTRLRIMNLPF